MTKMTRTKRMFQEKDLNGQQKDGTLEAFLESRASCMRIEEKESKTMPSACFLQSSSL